MKIDNPYGETRASRRVFPDDGSRRSADALDDDARRTGATNRRHERPAEAAAEWSTPSRGKGSETSLRTCCRSRLSRRCSSTRADAELSA
jgi:hypothetical protein